MAQRPGHAGHAWVFVNWLRSLRDAGHDVHFIDRLDPTIGDVDAGVDWVASVMRRHAPGIPWTVVIGPDETAGTDWPGTRRFCAGAILLDVMGYVGPFIEDAGLRVFVDIDPGFGQVWTNQGSAALFGAHERYVTVGLNMAGDDCDVPDVGVDWITTCPPVDLESWRDGHIVPADRRFTTVATWRGLFDALTVDGQRLGLRVHQARPLADLPARTGVAMEMALDIDPTDVIDRNALCHGGWTLIEPRVVASDLADYRCYIRGSFAEFSIAKEAYVILRTGWFSDRSACYLAAGRPVVTSDTGFGRHLDVGLGLLTYTSVDEAQAAIESVTAHPRRHARAAADLARDRFDGRRVVRSLMDRLA